PAGGGRDLAAIELDAVLVADAVERRQQVGGELAGFLQHGLRDVAVEIAVMAGRDGRFQARAVVQRKQDVVDGGAVGHGVPRGERTGRGTRSSHETSDLSTPNGRACRSCRANLPVEICVPTLLKSLISLYSPALSGIGPAAVAAAVPSGLLGRSQAVRQRILIPPFGGSIPPAPATGIIKPPQSSSHLLPSPSLA